MFSGEAAQVSTGAQAITLDTRPRAIAFDVDAAPVSLNKLVSEHWQSRGHRRQRERRAVARGLEGKRRPLGPWLVTFTRIGSSILDSDNLSIAFKSFRDEVCDWLGVDDRDSDAVRFEYEQRKARIKVLRLQRDGRQKPGFRCWARIEIAHEYTGPCVMPAATSLVTCEGASHG
jgi:predicted Fe-S protein YdhL (DUF1289 family)